ncbi:MAG TPA: glycosyltransferase family 2 protein [Candidatus Saccharimonadia bacterium]|nr:glycosyltransferase family 2 protein [Candidatus Saccharimonadia bacterium]
MDTVAKTQLSGPGVAIVVLGWNNKALLDECFASIKSQTYQNLQTIYVDNGSKDGSAEHVRKTHPEVDVIDTGFNNGFAVGNNIGFKRALEDKNCRYVVALNTDAVITPEWTSRLVAFAAAHPQAACLQGLTLNYFKRELVDSTGIYVDGRAAPLQIGYNLPYDGSGSRKVFGVNAAAAMYTRIFLDRQPFGDDYFDPDLFMYYEDVDLSARALALGMENYFCAEAVAYHMGSASSGGNPKFMLTMVHRNLPLVLLKSFPASVILRALPRWTWVELLRVFNFVRERRYGLALAIIKGRLRGLILLPRFWAKRRRLLRLGKSNTAEFRRLMCG